MSDMLPILTGLVVVSALAIVASSDKKNDKEHKEPKEKKEKEEKKEKKDDDFKKLFGFFKKNLSSKKKPKRHFKLYDSKGKTKRNKEGYSYRIVKPVSK